MMVQRLASLLLLATLTTGCAALRLGRPAPARDYDAAVAAAKTAADSGKWATADRLLSDFMLRHAGSAEAREALYWRGLFRLAPSNDTASQRMAIPALEQYLARPGGRHRTEVQVLVETARARQALRADAAAKEREIEQVRAALGRAQERPAAGSPPAEQPANDRALAQEVERLKAELAKANQELERIRRRLARQTP